MVHQDIIHVIVSSHAGLPCNRITEITVVIYLLSIGLCICYLGLLVLSESLCSFTPEVSVPWLQ